MANVTSIVQSYVDTLIIQYHDKPKARALIQLFVDSLLADGIALDVRDGYNIDTAVGVQLDVIGKYVGLDRYYLQQVLTNYFSFINYSEVASPPVDRIGFSNYTDFESKSGKFLTYPNIISGTYQLPDDIYRQALKLKIIQNNSNFSHKDIDDNSVFTAVASSLGDMEMTYIISSDYYLLAVIALQKKLFPVPMGVRLIGVVIRSVDTIFGFTTYNGDVSSHTTGFSNYADYGTKVGETLTYSKILN